MLRSFSAKSASRRRGEECAAFVLPAESEGAPASAVSDTLTSGTSIEGRSGGSSGLAKAETEAQVSRVAEQQKAAALRIGAIRGGPLGLSFLEAAGPRRWQCRAEP